MSAWMDWRPRLPFFMIKCLHVDRCVTRGIMATMTAIYGEK